MGWFFSNVAGGVVRFIIGVVLTAICLVWGLAPAATLAEWFGSPPPWVTNPWTRIAIVIVGVLIFLAITFSRRGRSDDYKSALENALLQNPERVKSSPLYIKLKYNFEPKTGYKSPADQVRDGKVEFQKLYDQARKKDLESYLIAGHMAGWLRENARFCYASSADFFDVLKFIETRMDDLHAIFRNERVATKATADPFGDVKSLSNVELKEATIRFAAQMRTFEINSKVEARNSELPVPTNLAPDQREKFYSDQIIRSQHLSARIKTEYHNTFLQASIVLRDELKGRLQRTGIFAVDAAPRMPLIAFDGMLAGPHPIADVADHLDAMARRLQ